jgi:hypothetical protein
MTAQVAFDHRRIFSRLALTLVERLIAEGCALIQP